MLHLRNVWDRRFHLGDRFTPWRTATLAVPRNAALATAALLLTFAAAPARAQGSGEITGTVTDSNGAIIPKAEVTLLNQATGAARTVPTNSAGLFDFAGIDVGKYNITVKVSGFTTYKKTDIVMNVAQTLKEDIPLQAGGEGQTVTVEADALQVQSETNEVSTLITGQQMVQLATNGRNVISLTSLGTGVASTNPSFNGVTAQGSSFNLSFNGMRPDHNNWLIDGGEVYDRGSGGKLDVMPAPDMLDEFQVLSSNYTPDYGISSGGTVSMVLKGGTKRFHGGLWEFNRNQDFNANNYFSKQSNQPRPTLQLNIFGGQVGGPVAIPHLYNNDLKKTFFFAGEEWRRLILGSTPNSQDTVPLADFPTAGQPFTYVPWGSDLTRTNTCPNGSGGPGIICVPQTSDPAKLAQYAANGLTAGSPFPNNTIPAALLDSNAVLFMGTGAIPKPNAGPTNYIASPKQPTSVREDVVRVDHNFNDKYKLLGSWIHDSMSQTIIPTQWSGDSYSTVGDVFSNPSWAAVIKLSQQLTPTLLNETALNVNGNTISVVPTGIYQQPAGWSAKSFFDSNTANKLPQIGFSNGPLNTTYTAIYWPWHNSYLNYQIRDDLSKIAGRHALKVGVSYMRGDKNQQLQADTQGDYGFNGSAYSQSSYANFLLGFASSYQQLQNQRTDHFVNNTYSIYAQDDWHASQKLTLNLGVRYDAMPHVYEKNNQLANFNPASYTAANAQSPDTSTGVLNPNGPGFAVVNGESFYLNGLDIAGTNGVPRQLVQNSYLTIQPRVGFAYDVGGNGKTVVRGGFGLFFERVQGNDTYDIDSNPPFSYQPQVNNVYFSNPSTSANSGATATAPVGPAGLREENTYYPNPGTIQYSLGFQQSIAPSVVIGLGYVGTSGWNQDDIREINDLNLGSSLVARKAVATNSTLDANGNTLNATNIACTSATVGSQCFLPSPNYYRPFQGFSNIGQEENAQNFDYNSLQAMFRMEQKHGFTLQFSYTWSHEIDIQSADLTSSTLAGSGGFLSNPYDARYDRGSGSFDRRHIFNANYIYTVPFLLHSNNSFERTLLGGWEIAGVTVAESGTPVNIYYNTGDTLGLGGNTTNRPNVTGKVSYPKTQAQWFNTSAFSDPIAPWTNGGATTGFGDARKDNVVGPGLFNWNLSLYKTFKITRGDNSPTFQLRAESYNTFNHTQFNNIDTGTSDTNYGKVTSTYDPRTLQFGAKFLF